MGARNRGREGGREGGRKGGFTSTLSGARGKRKAPSSSAACATICSAVRGEKEKARVWRRCCALTRGFGPPLARFLVHLLTKINPYPPASHSSFCTPPPPTLSFPLAPSSPRTFSSISAVVVRIVSADSRICSGGGKAGGGLRGLSGKERGPRRTCTHTRVPAPSRYAPKEGFMGPSSDS